MHRLIIVTESDKVFSDAVIKYGLISGEAMHLKDMKQLDGISAPMVVFMYPYPFDGVRIKELLTSIQANIFDDEQSLDKCLQGLIDRIEGLTSMYHSFNMPPTLELERTKKAFEDAGFSEKNGFKYDIELIKTNNPYYGITPRSVKAQLLVKMIAGYIHSVILPSRKVKKPVFKGNTVVWE